MAVNACDIDFKSAAWGLRNGWRFQGSVKLQEQPMKNRGVQRMSFGSQLNVAIIRWTLLPLLHFHPTFKSYISWTHASYLMHVIGSFYHISVRLAGSCHDLGWVDYLVGGLKCVVCVFVWFGMYFHSHGLEATQKQSLPLPVRGVLRQQRPLGLFRMTRC